MGEGRNSYSKTDTNATFMRMKEDHMRNGQLKPAYNVQIAVNSEYITGIDVLSDRTDFGTLVPFLKTLQREHGKKYESVTADAGYERLGNYLFLESNGQLSFIKPANYEYQKSAKHGHLLRLPLRDSKKQLKAETELAAQGVTQAGESYFEGLNTEGYRITWIDADGSVLYDNEANAERMENHLEREEVAQAIKDGYGESVRYSSTLADKQFYAAKRLPDGSVLRLSVVQMAVWTLLLGFAQPICLVILIALVLSFVLASRLAKKIVKPINELDLDDPEQYYGKEEYKEIEPLLWHIAVQQGQLKKDQAQIEKTALIRQEFTANVSHELKTPLHAISGYAELLENGMVKADDIQPFAGKIRAEASRMAKLVEDIIDLTELDNGGAEMKWEHCDLYRIAENAVDSLDAAASAMNVTVSVEGTDAPVKAIPRLP